MTKCTADNERFGATAAVTPLKATCEHERKYPAERLVKAAADAKPPDVSGNPTSYMSTKTQKVIENRKVRY